MSQHIRAEAMRLPPEHASLTIEGLEQLTNITKLSMEAVNAMNDYGHTPSELVAIIWELRDAVIGLRYNCNDEVASADAAREFADDILTKTEGFA